VRRLVAVLALALPLLAGCYTPLVPPDDFVELEEGEYSGFAYRATNAHGVVVAVRELDNSRNGSLTFWTAAIRDRLREVRGYALVEELPVSCASGETGRRLRFGRDEGTKPYVYELSIFVVPESTFSESELFLVESGGLREDYEKVRTDLDHAIAGFRTN
jgi:hypothetical protein